MSGAWSNSYYSSQYATTTPKIFSVNSMATNCPRDLCSAVSVAQTGTIAFRIPVPHPLIRRALDHQLYPYVKTGGIPLLTKDHPNVILSRSLKRSAKYGPSCTEANGLDTAISVSKGTSHEAPYQRTEIIDRDLKISNSAGIWIRH